MTEARRPCSRCNRNRAPKFYRSARGRICLPCQRGRTQIASRDVRLTENYGITHADYLVQLAHQGGVCAGCGGTRKTNLDCDHDHKKEKAGLPPRECLRGLLCRSCNKLLAMARDSPERLECLAAYLRSGGVWVWEPPVDR